MASLSTSLWQKFLKWIINRPRDTNLFALPFFLLFQALFGLFLFKTRFVNNRWWINILSLFCLFFINIILPSLLWPFRNKQSCSILHMSSCIYIGVVDYKLFEIIHSPLSFVQRHHIKHYWQMSVCLLTPSIIIFKKNENQISGQRTRSKAVASLIEIFIIIPLVSFVCTNLIIEFR